MHSTLHSLETKPELRTLKVVDSVASPQLKRESIIDSQNQDIMMLLDDMKLENERLKKLLELQFRLAHGFDLPYHRERKWAQFKSEHRL